MLRPVRLELGVLDPLNAEPPVSVDRVNCCGRCPPCRQHQGREANSGSCLGRLRFAPALRDQVRGGQMQKRVDGARYLASQQVVRGMVRLASLIGGRFGRTHLAAEAMDRLRLSHFGFAATELGSDGARQPDAAARETVRFFRFLALANETAHESISRPRCFKSPAYPTG